MDNNILNTFITKYFKQPKSIIYLVILSVLVCANAYVLIDNIYVWLIIVVCNIVGLIYYIIETVKYNSLPVANEKCKAPVLIRIFAKTEEEYKDIKFKLLEEFEKFFVTDDANCVYIPYHLIEKYSFNDKKNILKLLKNTNCIFLVNIRTKSEDVRENAQYITEIKLGVMHPRYEEQVEKTFQKECNTLGVPIRRLKYSQEEKLEVLETTAKRLSYVCQYILARAYFLSGSFKEANMISRQLYQLLLYENESETIIKALKQVSRFLCYDTHYSIAREEFLKEKNDVEVVIQELNNANCYIKDTYEYHLTMAYFTFLKSRNIKEAKEHLNFCKQKKGNNEWKYSIAFLSAYAQESEGQVIYKYTQALKMPYHNVVQLISFIEELPELKYNAMLKFALFILYLEAGNFETSKELLKEYLQSKGVKSLEQNTLTKLMKRYGKTQIKEICDEQNINLKNT